MQGQEDSIHSQLVRELTPPPKELTRMHATDSSGDEHNVSDLSSPLAHKRSADRAQVQASLESIRGIQNALKTRSGTAAVAPAAHR